MVDRLGTCYVGGVGSRGGGVVRRVHSGRAILLLSEHVLRRRQVAGLTSKLPLRLVRTRSNVGLL